MSKETQGARIRALFQSAKGDCRVIAPFIKLEALESLLKVISQDSRLTCVTRWLPKDIAAGASDPEIFDLLENRGNSELALVDQLHAKLYIAGSRCLAGSANVTLAGMGEVRDGGNIEVLVETTIDDSGISSTLNAIDEISRPATRSMALMARLLGDQLANSSTSNIVLDQMWFPRSKRPQDAYKFYTEAPTRHVGGADKTLLIDLSATNLPLGLSEERFKEEIRSLLSSLPMAKQLLNATLDTRLTREDAKDWLNERSSDTYSASDLWVAFVNWMECFFEDLVVKQEIAEFALRRARLLK